MDTLPIQASPVPCERVFSSSKETTVARRNKLSPQLVEALQVLKFEHKHNKMLNFIAGLDMDEEMMELEAVEEAQPTEDLNALFQNLHHWDYPILIANTVPSGVGTCWEYFWIGYVYE